jgi:hypothetical protein
MNIKLTGSIITLYFKVIIGLFTWILKIFSNYILTKLTHELES